LRKCPSCGSDVLTWDRDHQTGVIIKKCLRCNHRWRDKRI